MSYSINKEIISTIEGRYLPVLEGNLSSNK